MHSAAQFQAAGLKFSITTIINPRGNFSFRWDLAIIVVLIYNLIEIPVIPFGQLRALTFVAAQLRVCFNAEPAPWSSADIFNFFTDLFFCAVRNSLIANS